MLALQPAVLALQPAQRLWPRPWVELAAALVLRPALVAGREGPLAGQSLAGGSGVAVLARARWAEAARAARPPGAPDPEEMPLGRVRAWTN